MLICFNAGGRILDRHVPRIIARSTVQPVKPVGQICFNQPSKKRRDVKLVDAIKHLPQKMFLL